MPGRFLIIQTAFIGDAILATALLEDLHRAWPNAKIDLLVRRGNESLFTDHPFINELLIWEKKTGKYQSLWQLLGKIRATPYKAVINLQRFGATGILTAFSGASVTIGFDKNPFSTFFTYSIPHQIGPNLRGVRHEVERNNDLLRPLDVPNYGKSRPKLYPSRADYSAVAQWQSMPYVCIAPTSVWFTKQYPASGWIKVIERLPANWRVYLLGAPSDMGACEHIRVEVGHDRVVNLAGQLSLLQSAALLQGARMNYVNDSAPLHLCSAMNAPTTAVFCSTVPGFGFGPLADNSRVAEVRELLECRPCNLHGRKDCPLSHFRCAYAIEIDDIAGGPASTGTAIRTV
ncbi:glycosyltransferase family 9 protein [Fibrella sp. USSR17]